MNDTLNDLNKWLQDLASFSLPKWRNLPDLDLYMDQVVTYLERELSPLTVEEQEKMITTWMINNYVKGDLIASPVKKKYSRDHIAYLFAICSIKQILSISDIASLFNFQNQSNRESPVIYEFFRKTQSEMVNSISKESIEKITPYLEKGNTLDDSQLNCFLFNYVFKLAIEAEVKKIIANKMLYLLSKSNESDEDIKENIDKDQTKKVKK